MNGYNNDLFWVQTQEYLPIDNRLDKSTIPAEYYLSVANVDVHIDHYKTANPKGRVILFHGVGGNGRLLSFIALPLVKSGFEVVCPDMPLYGYTRYVQTITYNTWVSCGVEIVRHYQKNDDLPTFLLGLSAGGMLAYQVTCKCDNISGLIFTCILDQRNKEVTKYTASNPLLGVIAKHFVAIARIFAGSMKIPMKWVGNMKAIVNNQELASLLMRDKKSSGAMVSLDFIHSMLNPIIEIEPENFSKCPILLVHPGEDRWTDIRLSSLFYDRLSGEKQKVILEGAGHFPIEKIGLHQMEKACVEFLDKHLELGRSTLQ